MMLEAIHVGYETLVRQLNDLIESFPEGDRPVAREMLVRKYRSKLQDSKGLNGRILSESEQEIAVQLYSLVVKYLEGGQS